MSDAVPSSKSKPWVGVLKYIIGFALLAFVLWWNWNGKLDQDGLREPGLVDLLDRIPHVGMFALTALFACGAIFSQYCRWYVLVRAMGLPFTFRNALRLGMVGTFYNVFLPGAIGGDIIKAVFIAKDQPTRKPAAVSTVIADRLLGLFGLLVFGGFVGGALWLGGNERIMANSKLQFIIIACAIGSTIGAIGYLMLGVVGPTRSLILGDRIKSWPKGETLSELWYAAWMYRQRPLAILAGVALSAVGHTMMMLVFHFAVQVFPPDDASLLGTFSEHCVIAPIGFIVQALVPLPGGLGAGEFTFGGLYELIRPNGGKVVGLTGRLAIRVIEWVLGAFCYAAYLLMKKQLPVETSATSEAP